MNFTARTLLALALPSSIALSASIVPVREETPATATTAAFPEIGLTLTLPQLDKLRSYDGDDQRKGIWRGKLGTSSVTIQLLMFEAEHYNISSPEDVVTLMSINQEKPDDTTFVESGFLGGSYGYVCYSALARSDRHVPGTTRLALNTYYLCGMLDGSGYVVEVQCKPALAVENAGPIHTFFEEGVHYDGETANIQWTDEEALARFKKDAPEDTHDEMEKILRTEHYLILSNSSGKKKFAQKMEEGYEKIKEVFPFQEISCRKLMPVFLFRNKGEYYAFCNRVAGWSESKARGTKGHAWKDYYATWYEAPNDPVHIHEATHQIFANRLGLHGGGSWFQEGVAEYIETRENDRNAIATQVKKGRAMPLRDFFQVKTLAFKGSDDIKGGNQAGDLYKMAALFIEFMRESKFAKEHFADFIQKMGRTPRSDIVKIEAVFQELYDVTIEELEEEFKQYCKRR